MTRTHTATIEIRRWKAHDCAGCNCRYAYLMTRKVAYGGSTPERAAEKAEAAAERGMAHGVDRQPCPNCGLYQPDMIGGQRRSLHAILLLPIVLTFALMGGIELAHLVQADRMVGLLIATAALFGIVGFLVDLQNPNRNLDANCSRAYQEIAAGRMRIVKPGMPLPSGFELPATRHFGLLAGGLLIFALTAFAAPELLRRQAGWPLNPEAFPPVVGPGDTTYIYLPDSISSIKGYWNGVSQVTAHVDGESNSKPVSLTSSTQQADWGNSIHVKRDDRASAQRLWVRLQLQPDGNYSGKTLDCEITLAVQYPVVQNDKAFVRRQELYHQPISLHLAAPLAGHRYQVWLWWGFGSGIALLVASCIARLLAANALARTARPGELLEEL